MSDDTKALAAEQERRLRTLASSSIVGADVRAILADRDALAERCEKLREDAERWEKLVELWHASTELQLTLDEDGWSITVIEAVEATPSPGRWTGDTPDGAIDALAAPKDAP